VGALSAFCIAVAFGVLAGYMLHRGTSTVRTLIWVAVAYAVCELNTVMRTQSFAYPLFVLMMVILLEDDRRHRFSRSLLALPLVFLLWANLHGSVLLAAPIVVIYCMWAARTTCARCGGARWRRTWGCGLHAAGAALDALRADDRRLLRLGARQSGADRPRRRVAGGHIWRA
jgi:hypothetical protein